MQQNLNCFIPFVNWTQVKTTYTVLSSFPFIKNIYLLTKKLPSETTLHNLKFILIDSLFSSATMKQIAQHSDADFSMLYTKMTPLEWEPKAIQQCIHTLQKNNNKGMVYSDHYRIISGVKWNYPVLSYQKGSLRNDFYFGSVMFFSAKALQNYLITAQKNYRHAGLYELILFISRNFSLRNIHRPLYIEDEGLSLPLPYEQQFDYVNSANRESQIEMEEVCTNHLKEIGCYLVPYKYKLFSFNEVTFNTEASIIIPVFNRISTIADAIDSALKQQADFPFNILVVDNHSTDGTSQIIEDFAKKDERVLHLIPERTDLGIGGCWNYAINHPQCGKFSVQLDSDDLYSSNQTLSKIIKAFYEQQCAMLVGSYRICNFNLETIPPGIIDHREWSETNGRNNALRINGFGAPRAYYTPVIRSIQFPNVSYGEDYAVGLRISREYLIGRIYEVLYLCRRWKGNSDALLSIEKTNENNFYKDSIRTNELKERKKLSDTYEKPTKINLDHFFKQQLLTWGKAKENYNALFQLREKRGNNIILQYNPKRIVSTSANTNINANEQGICFLCSHNRPAEQIELPTLCNYDVLVNPYPILSRHYTIASQKHNRQSIKDCYADICLLASRWKGMLLFYNGPFCGASAPNHLHIQAGNRQPVPLIESLIHNELHTEEIIPNLYYLKDYLCPAFILTGSTQKEREKTFNMLYNALPIMEDEWEPRMNVLCIQRTASKKLFTVIFPRAKHRPDCYYKEGREQLLISPGALDMAGLLIVPRKEDFDKMSVYDAGFILKEVALDYNAIDAIINKLKNE